MGSTMKELEPHQEIMEVSPDDARALLEQNKHNRNVNQNLVIHYARAMRDGLWNFDATPIRLAPDGELLDGQHRLLAVVVSKTTQRFSVWFNIDPATQSTMDTGRKRTFSDALAIAGEKQTAVLATVIGIAYRYDKGARNVQLVAGGSGAMAMVPELMTYFQQNKQPLVNSLAPGGIVWRRFQGGPSFTILSAAFYILARIDAEDAADFYSKLAAGENLALGDPIYALREAFVRLSGKHKPHQSNFLALIIKAWNAYREGRQIKLLSFKPGGSKPEGFPEPV